MYVQYTQTISDYSFSDSETISFMLSKKDSLKFEKNFNKGIKSGLSIEDSIERSGGDLKMEDFGYIKVLREDTLSSQIVDFKESKNGIYLLVERFEDFSLSHEKHTLLKNLNKTEGELRFLVYQEGENLKSLQKKEEDIQKEISSLMKKNYEKIIEKNLKSLKGKQKKDSEQIEQNLRKKYEEKNRLEVNKLFDEKDKIDVVIKDRMNYFFHKLLKEKFNAIIVDVDLEYESYENTGKI